MEVLGSSETTRLATDKNDANESKKFFMTEMHILLRQEISVDDIVHKRLAHTLLQQP